MVNVSSVRMFMTNVNSFYGKALPRGSTPYPFIYHFDRKGTPFVYPPLTNSTPFDPFCIPKTGSLKTVRS